jgi:hypothetical protein
MMTMVPVMIAATMLAMMVCAKGIVVSCNGPMVWVSDIGLDDDFTGSGGSSDDMWL